ncbi:hypothetical protein B7486_22570 [cyanobacterium TDX16]|nr:hypothetical protein B7486_22570 [cyanobacterium TDX16]
MVCQYFAIHTYLPSTGGRLIREQGAGNRELRELREQFKIQNSKFPTPHTPHPTPHTLHPFITHHAPLFPDN